jgi:hypothetical protein
VSSNNSFNPTAGVGLVINQSTQAGGGLILALAPTGMFVKHSLNLLLIVALLICASCDDGHLRGSVANSPDGKTYLLVAQGNNCNKIMVDGAVWSYAIGKPGAISPGDHVIECNGGIRFTIPVGVTFKFDYWGP